MPRIVCVSDTHDRHEKVTVPDGDALVHAGDFSMNGRPPEIRRFNDWLGALPHRHKIVIAGNHDWFFDLEPRSALTAATYLEDAEATVAGLRIWGSPWQPEFAGMAFHLPRGPALAAKWALVPDGIDVLDTHTPPRGTGDRTESGREVGCADLRDALLRIRPRLHVFGHGHEARGRWRREDTTFVNAAICDMMYGPVHAPVVVDL